MHSYSEQDPELQKALNEQRNTEIAAAQERLQKAYDKAYPDQPLGRTGQFPEGQLTPQDEGELRFQIGAVNGAVVLNFGSPVQAIGLNPAQALGLADMLRKHAKSLRPDKKRSHGGKGRGK